MMARSLIILLLIALALTGCRFGSADDEIALATEPVTVTETAPPESASPTSGAEAQPPTSTTLPSPAPTDTAVLPSPTVTSSPTPTETPAPADLSIASDGVFIHPVPSLYAGDMVTVQVVATVPESISPSDVQVHLLLNEERIAMGTLNGRNLGGDALGLFAWVWDTTDFTGEHQVSIVLDPDDAILVGDEDLENNRVDVVVSVLEADDLPLAAQDATWITSETEHAIIHMVSGTAAARDIALLEAATERAAEQAIAQLQEEPEAKFDVYFVDRVLGQGGYASSALVVSYLDRDYAGGGLHEVLVHEIVHLLDQQFAHHRVPFLVEGVAVWATGGHYKQENLDQRMAALREAGLYVPLAELIDDFYPTQHEIGYLQGAGFVNYLANQFGWPTVRSFYADVNPNEGEPLSSAVDRGLQSHFNKNLATVESEWIAYLERIPYGQDVESDLLVTVRYYDVMRRYQLQYDPTAHFLQAWLPFPQEVESRNITADLTRHPEEEVNVALETMLAAVDTAMIAGNYSRASALLDSVERVLASEGLFVDPIASDYLEIVRQLSALGFRVQAIEIEANESRVLARDGNSLALQDLSLVLRNENWVLLN